MWAMIAMNWVIATLIMAVVVLWIITRLRIWRSGEVRGKVTFRQGGKRKRDAHPHLGAAAESRPSHQGDRLGAELDGQLSSPARSGAAISPSRRADRVELGGRRRACRGCSGRAGLPVARRAGQPPVDVDAGVWLPRDRTPTHGYEPTREAAMAAFAKSWRRE
jgi:hypothetical protein